VSGIWAGPIWAIAAGVDPDMLVLVMSDMLKELRIKIM
jgi:hypothetical protein